MRGPSRPTSGLTPGGSCRERPAPDDETLADAIVRINAALEKLVASGLNTKAIHVLVAHDTGFGLGTVRTVLTSLSELKRKYCR